LHFSNFGGVYKGIKRAILFYELYQLNSADYNQIKIWRIKVKQEILYPINIV